MATRSRAKGFRAVGREVIPQAAYTVEPWCVRETDLRLDVLSQSESSPRGWEGHEGVPLGSGRPGRSGGGAAQSEIDWQFRRAVLVDPGGSQL